jgi:predicted RNA-binding Zn-ribbon protein involved in translation (DUF1610 family)
MLYDKRHCIARAKDLLLANTPHAIRYAALELRTCMELHTYEKLRSFTDFVPESVLKTWQPPQAVKALLEFDETADQSFTIEVGVETTVGEVPTEMHLLGNHEALPLKWLRKHYNKVGALLHAPMDAPPVFALAEHAMYLGEVVAALDCAVSGTILGGRFTDAYCLVCGECGKTIARNRVAVKAGKTAVCFTPGCGAEYRATAVGEESASFAPVLTGFTCSGCETQVRLFDRVLKVGGSFACPTCGKRHSIIGHNWLYTSE